MSEIIKITSVNPKEIESLAKEFKEKLRTLEKELNNHLLRYGFEISYHYELNIIKISDRDKEKIHRLTKQEPILSFPVIKIKPRKEISEVYVLKDGAIILKRTVIEKSKVREQYYILTSRGLQKIE